MSDTSGISSTITSAIRTNGVGAITATVLAGVLVAMAAWVGGNFAPHVATNAALQSASTANFSTGLWRDDYAAGNGAPPLFYYPSASACSLNSGAGDNGSQVQSADGKCWLARFSIGTFDVREFGANGDVALLADATMTGGSANLYSASGPFKPTDVGKQVFVWGASASQAIGAPPTPTPGQIYLGSLGATTYYVKTTYVGSGGETIASSEASFLTTANYALTVASPPPTFGAYSWSVYVGTASGAESKQNVHPLLIGQTWTIGPLGLVSGDTLPSALPATSIAPPLFATISAYVDAHDVTLSAAAGSSVSSAGWGYGTDNAAALAASLSACGTAGGGFVILPDAGFLDYSASPTIPTGCSFGSLNTVMAPGASNAPQAPTLYLNPAYTINGGASTAITGIAIWKWGIPALPGSVRGAIDAYSAFSGTAVTWSTSNATLKNAQIIGFAQCLNSTSSSRVQIENVFEDCNSGEYIKNDYDYTYLKYIEHFPFYTNSGALYSTYNIAATSGFGTSGGNITVTTGATPAVEVGDIAFIGQSGNGRLLNNLWTIGAVSGNTVTLLDSVADASNTYTVTGSWTAGGNAIQVSDVSNIGYGDEVSATGVGSSSVNTVYSVDPHQNILGLQKPTTVTETSVTVTIIRTPYNQLAAHLYLYPGQHGGDATFIGDSNGVCITALDSYGFQSGLHIDSTSLANALHSPSSITCDGRYDLETDCIDLTSHAAFTNSMFFDGVTTTGNVGTPLWDATYYAAGAPPNIILTNGAFSVNPSTANLFSIASGRAQLSNITVGGSGVRLTIGSGVGLVTFSGDDFNQVTLAETKPIANVALSSDTTLAAGSAFVMALANLAPSTIASLPSCGAALTGQYAFVSDATASAAATFHGTVAGSGSTQVNSLVSCNGSNWQYE